MGKDIVLGIGDYVVTNEPNTIVKTYALGSCIALILYDPIRQYLAMSHIALPGIREENTADQGKLGYYADNTIPFLLNEFKNKCGGKPILRVGIVGGAHGNPHVDLFAIGRKNLSKVMEHLGLHGVQPYFSDVGGNFGRTVEAETATGIVKVHRQALNNDHLSLGKSVEMPGPVTTVTYFLGKSKS